MQITREMRIGAGILAFIGVLAWMIPPTRPVTPTVGERPRDQGGASIAADAHDAGKYAPPPGALTAAPPAPSYQPDGVDGDDPSPPEEGTPLPSAPAVVRPLPTMPGWRGANPRFAEDADDDEDEPSQRDPGYMLGYRWAESNGVERPRDCRIWRGSPAEDGCRAYLREAEQDQDARDVSDWQQ